MRRIFVLLCLGIGGFLVLGACQKDNADIVIWESGDQEHGFAKGKKNGKKFEASAFAKRYRSPNSDYFYIQLHTFSSKGYFREDIIIGNAVAIKPKIYALETIDFEFAVTDDIASINYATSIDGGDVQGDMYRLDTKSEGNELKITSVDTTNNIVKGEFTATMYHLEPGHKTDSRNPNVVKFKRVRFEAEIVN